METASMLLAGIVLFTAIYGLSGMLLRGAAPRRQEPEVRSS
jgi:hypothetical protein